MCTYDTAHCTLTGSAKGPGGWFGLTAATVYFDHPVHARDAHTLNIDFVAPERGATARVAVELPAASAVSLCRAVAAVLLSAPDDLTGLDEAHLAALRLLVGSGHDVEEAPALIA